MSTPGHQVEGDSPYVGRSTVASRLSQADTAARHSTIRSDILFNMDINGDLEIAYTNRKYYKTTAYQSETNCITQKCHDLTQMCHVAYHSICRDELNMLTIFPARVLFYQNVLATN